MHTELFVEYRIFKWEAEILSNPLDVFVLGLIDLLGGVRFEDLVVDVGWSNEQCEAVCWRLARAELIRVTSPSAQCDIKVTRAGRLLLGFVGLREETESLGPSHLDILMQGVGQWNQWRKANQVIVPLLQSVVLEQWDLEYIDFSRTRIKWSNLRRASLRRALLNEADLTLVDLYMADLTEARLNKANLFLANLRMVDASNASFREAKLGGANLCEADLSGADFYGADMQGANLTGAKLLGAIHLLQAQVNSARGDSSTELPTGIWRPRHWLEGQDSKEPVSTPLWR